MLPPLDWAVVEGLEGPLQVLEWVHSSGGSARLCGGWARPHVTGGALTELSTSQTSTPLNPLAVALADSEVRDSDRTVGL